MVVSSRHIVPFGDLKARVSGKRLRSVRLRASTNEVPAVRVFVRCVPASNVCMWWAVYTGRLKTMGIRRQLGVISPCT